MKTHTENELAAILVLHGKWLRSEPDGQRADLSGSNLSGSDLRGSDLRGSDLSGSNLSGSNLSNIQKARLSIVPELGEFTAFKKTVEGIVTLRIPEHAQRSNATGRKCRASEALVIALPAGCTEAHSLYDSTFVYCVGRTVKPEAVFCDDRWQECASGIHFYLTRSEAEAHQ